MKKTVVIVLLLLFVFPVFVQGHPPFSANQSADTSHFEEYYHFGVKYFQRGDYLMADSMFIKCLKIDRNAKNALFSLAVSQLYLKDTVDFCRKILFLYNVKSDNEAGHYYFNLCGKADTVFRDRKYQKCTPRHSRYMIITESHKYQPQYKTVLVHKKGAENRAKSFSGKTIYVVTYRNSDVVAKYKLFRDGHRLFTFLSNFNVHYVGYDSFGDYLHQSPIYQMAKKELQLSDETLRVQYVLDKEGTIHAVKIFYMSKPLPPGQKKKLETYITDIILKQPEIKQPVFLHNRVNYLMKTFVSF